MNKKRVSEIVTVDEIKKWKKGDTITITAGTGSGKSYFIKNILYAFAKKENKKILFLIHRANCVQQFREEIKQDNKQDTIIIITYQKLENLYLNSKEFNFDEFEYIVCDEFHYFMGDAGFNKTTDISLNMILNQQNKIKIFMSATGKVMERYLKAIKNIDIKEYKLQITYDFIENLYFFNKDDTIFEILAKELIERKDEKAIFFIQSAKKAYNLYKKYKQNSIFNCSTSNSLYKYVDKENINKMLKEEKFNEQILITTSCLDAGVNIIDIDVKHIICDIEDTWSLLQCLGRKRMQNNNDKVNVYIKNINHNKLGGRMTQLKRKIAMAEYLKKNNIDALLDKYPRQKDINNIIYDSKTDECNKPTKKINELMLYKAKCDIAIISFMLSCKKYGYIEYITNELKKDYTILEDYEDTNKLEEYLENIVGKKLFKQEQQELIKKIDVRVNRKQQRSRKKLNDGLDMLKLPYIILPKKSNDMRYWVIEKIDI